MKEFMSEPLHQKAYQAFGDLIIETARRRRIPPATGARSISTPASPPPSSPPDGIDVPPRSLRQLSRPTPSWSASPPASPRLAFTASLKCGHANSQGRLPSLVRPGRRIPPSASSRCAALAASRVATASCITVRLAPSSSPPPPTSRTTATSPPTPRSATPPPSPPSARSPTRRCAPNTSRDHQALFRRVSLDLGATPAAKLPTDERIAAFATRQRSGAGRAALPVRPLPDDRRPAAPAASPPTCRASGTIPTSPPGTASTPTTSTPK